MTNTSYALFQDGAHVAGGGAGVVQAPPPVFNMHLATILHRGIASMQICFVRYTFYCVVIPTQARPQCIMFFDLEKHIIYMG